MAQRVLVTAGGDGIGKETARAFAASGARVCVCDIDGAALKTAAKDIPGLITTICDVSRSGDHGAGSGGGKRRQQLERHPVHREVHRHWQDANDQRQGSRVLIRCNG